MKKITLALVLLTLLLSGCAKEPADKKDVKKDTTSSVETKTEKKEQKNTEKTENVQKPAEKEQEKELPVKDSSGNAVTSENLADMIDKANDENTDEATKREILDEIDYILKQAEKNAQQ